MTHLRPSPFLRRWAQISRPPPSPPLPAVEYRLIIREAETLSVVQLYSSLDRIEHLEWSPNSMYVMCGLYSRAIIQIWSAEQSDWACKIDEGPAGVQVRCGGGRECRCGAWREFRSQRLMGLQYQRGTSRSAGTRTVGVVHPAGQAVEGRLRSLLG